MYFVTTKQKNMNGKWRIDFGRIYPSYLRGRGISIESYLYEILARSRNTGTPVKITSVWELRLLFKIRQMKDLTQAIN